MVCGTSSDSYRERCKYAEQRNIAGNKSYFIGLHCFIKSRYYKELFFVCYTISTSFFRIKGELNCYNRNALALYADIYQAELILKQGAIEDIH